jgi:hypothetical protein
MFGRSHFAALASLVLAAGSRAPSALIADRVRTQSITSGQVVTRAGMARAFSAPYGRRSYAWIAPSYPRKDRMRTAAQHKRASKKARNVAKHRRHA